MSSNRSNSSSIGFVGLLTIVFIVLKLIKFDGNTVNNWSWWWVLSPIWISAVIVFFILISMIVVFLIKER
jgi:hypothetical protein